MLTFSKGYTAPTYFIQFPPNFSESRFSVNIQAITFSDVLPYFKSICETLKRRYLSYIVIIHEATVLVSSGKQSVKAPGPLVI